MSGNVISVYATSRLSCLMFCFVVCILCCQTCLAETPDEPLAAGQGVFSFAIEGTEPAKTIRVFYVKPERTTANTPVWFVMHGIDRNADEYRDKWIELSQQYRAIVLAPEFNSRDYPGSRAYNLGNMFDEDGEPVDRSQWSYTVIDKLFDHVVQREGLKDQGYCLFGHSAGAQFVHRLMMFVPEAKVRLAVSANAGWYTLPDLDRAFPYGLDGSTADTESLKTAFGKPMVLLLGREDTDPNHKHLNKAAEAEAQGPHRLARGHYFFDQAKASAQAMEVKLAWRLIEVPDVGHSSSRMSPPAAKLMARAPRAR